ncbi:MAG: 1-deoxy-D-xylulose-5-phosphate reductoisomerase [Deferribacteres bacterium]|nr:1-deoxy-D-xylulose-5-phosphate reductoisomerase [candidate division KSB1 bacterium]MCB9504146.1 1-deoxy-D-xylulose-5-phosphate reductoisomerase [Deferribacteres bacterium]
MRKICLFGATGSIGKSCIDIVTQFPDKFSFTILSAHSDIDALFELTKRYRPQTVVFSGVLEKSRWVTDFRALGVELLVGPNALESVASEAEYDVLVNAIVGAAGLKSTLRAIERGKNIALANKETLVTAGELVMHLAKENNVAIIPIDSEHSALWQCLVGERPQDIERIILTASGGPFREKPKSFFREVTVEQALNHPNWDMGAKITIDSATLMNKGLEVIEAYWLFGVKLEQIAVVIHPQSIIHSMVEFVDSSIKAQMGLPDMRVPIQYALSYPHRLPNKLPRLDFTKYNSLTFFEPDTIKFRCLQLAFDSLAVGGTAAAVLNAANEESVWAFLDKKIRFDQIPVLIEDALANHSNHKAATLENVLYSDQWAREFVQRKI